MKLLRLATLALATTPALLASPALAGEHEEELFPIFLVDDGTDQVYRGIDADDDFTYNGSGEMIVFYDDTVGSLALDAPTSLHTSPNDFLYVADSSLERILAMEDLDDDGDCHEPGEHFVYVDATNGSGVGVENLRNVYVRYLGETWATTSNTSLAENDAILFFEDGNSDGDANDSGEAKEYYVIAPGGAVGDSDPTAVILHPDGLVYYVENGSTGAIAKGVYCLDDLNDNGVIDPPLEVTPYYLPTGAGMDLVALDVDEEGVVYLVDDGLERIFRLEDANMDGVIAPGSEDCVWYTAPGSLVTPNITVDNEGHLLMSLEVAAIDRMWLLEDEDDDCNVDHGTERAETYNDVAGDVAYTQTTGVDWDFHGHEEVGTAYCFGIKGRCPCSNDGSGFTGCENSTGSGAILEAEGTASVSLDDLELHCLGLPPGVSAIAFQGNDMVNGGMGIHFYDGLFCTNGNIKRLGVRTADGGGEAMWGPDILAGQGQWGVGDTRNFQVWYRDNMGPCGQTANTSNAVSVTFER